MGDRAGRSGGGRWDSLWGAVEETRDGYVVTYETGETVTLHHGAFRFLLWQERTIRAAYHEGLGKGAFFGFLVGSVCVLVATVVTRGA